MFIYEQFYRILNKFLDGVSCVNYSISFIVVVLLGSTLLLSMPLTLQSQLAEARKQAKSGVTASPEGQKVNQKIGCTSDAVCLAKAINIVCMEKSLCYIGYNAPFLFSTPH
jgi:hypothetical protein